MSKNKIITTLIVIAAICSVLAGYLIYHFMSPQRATIYVFKNSYSMGDQISDDMLVPITVDSNIVVAGKNDDISSKFVTPAEYMNVIKSGDSLRMDVSEGMPLTTTMLSVQGGSTVEMNMKSDAVAVTVPVTRFTGVTNDLKEGARVNVYTVQDSVTILIQQNKRVLEVFKEEGAIVGVSLEEDVDESMELIAATTNGSIYLGLVDATGYQSVEGDDPYYVTDTTKYLGTDEAITQYSDQYLGGYGSFGYGDVSSETTSETDMTNEEASSEVSEAETEEVEFYNEEAEDATGTDTVFVPN